VDTKSRRFKYLCILFIGLSSQEGLDGRGMWHAWGKGEVHTGFWWGGLRERNDFQDLGVDGRILKWISKK
jgi:hypothetical protein